LKYLDFPAFREMHAGGTPDMRPITLKSAARQVADHLRSEIQRLDLVGGLPGPRRLAEQLGVNHKTVETALDLLEEEGLLVAQGKGRRRKIQRESKLQRGALRLHLLLNHRRDNSSALLTQILHRLREAGHAVTVAERRVDDYEKKPQEFLKWLEGKNSDAWIIHNGPRPLLEWLMERQKPIFAIAGERQELPIAGCGPDKIPAMRKAVAHLVSLGHRRIVLLARKQRLASGNGDLARAFIEELKRHELSVGEYNLPSWNPNPASFKRCLENLTRHAPPSAIIIDEPALFIATQQFFAARGLSAPKDLSMICMQQDPYFDWCRPKISHFEWDGAPMLRRILQWSNHMACGKPDIKQLDISSDYVEGGSVGAFKGKN